MKFDDFKNEGSEAAVKVNPNSNPSDQSRTIAFHTVGTRYLFISHAFLSSGRRKIQTTRT